MSTRHDAMASPRGAFVATPAEHGRSPAAVWMGGLLALSATTLSLAVSALVGWQRGSALAEQVLLAGFGGLAVLGAHWLPPLMRAVPVGLLSRLAGVLLWLACLIYAAMSHADFFISVQIQRADHRIAAMSAQALATATATPTVPKRTLASILEEQGGVQAKLMRTRFSEASCSVSCGVLKIRRVELQQRLSALAAEEEEVRRWQVTQDRLQARTEAARDDPVTARLQRDFGVTPAVASAVTVLPVAVILEGLGALCWCLVVQARGRLETSPSTRRVTAAVTEPVAVQVPETVDGHDPESSMLDSGSLAPVPSDIPQAGQCASRAGHAGDSQREVHELAAKVWVAIQQGQAKPTVRGIRAHLGIAQEKARAIARVIRGWTNEGKGQDVGSATRQGVSARLT